MERNILNLEDISYTGICRELLQYLWVIVVTGAAVWLGVSGLGKLTYTPTYTSSSTLVVSTRGGDDTYSGLSSTSQMANVFSQVFQSDVLRELIVKDVGEPVEGTISCRQIPETNLIVLEISSPNPRQAYIFLNSALKNYYEVSEYIFGNASLEVVQEPSIPEEPSNVSWLIARRNKLTALGILGMAGIILCFYFFRYTIKTQKVAERMLDGEIRGTIPYVSKKTGFSLKGFRFKKSKEAILLNSPTVSMEYAEACRKLEAGVEHYMRKKNQKILLVASIGENEGKSTIAVNMALALAERRKKVLLIDGDFRKPAQHKVFEKGKSENLSLSHVLKGKIQLEDAIQYDEQTGVYQLFQYHAEKNISAVLNRKEIERVLDECREKMDYVIVDCSPVAVAADAEIWMQEVDTVLLIVRQDWSDVRVINDTVDMIWQGETDFLGFALNAFREEWFSQKGYGYDYRDKGYGGYQSPVTSERR